MKPIVYRSLAPDQRGQPYSVEQPASEDELGFERRGMVRWFDPRELAKAAVEATISAVFGAYADKRDIESLLSEATWHDFSELLASSEDGIWLDYVADVGDGFDSTYTIAHLLGAETLCFDERGRGTTEAAGAQTRTERGRVLIMGGDQVYPTASREEYRARMVEPYRCALPSVAHADEAPMLLAIPGNHDWYDGLSSFLKVFCQSKWIGGWRTIQNRSYFAVKLTDSLWLWGIDIQLNDDIDTPQLDYFSELAANHMSRGSKIILCTAEPAWVYVETKTEHKPKGKREQHKENVYRNLGHFEHDVIDANGHELLVALAGDLHNYVRYEAAEDRDKHWIVSGGGGAYTYPTHHMPDRIELPGSKEMGGSPRSLCRESAFPSIQESRRKIAGALLFPFRNFAFSAFLGAYFTLFSWSVQSISDVRFAAQGGRTLLESFAGAFAVGELYEAVVRSPLALMLTVLFAVALYQLSVYPVWWKKLLHGGAHLVLHGVVLVLLMRLFSAINLIAVPAVIGAPGLEPSGLANVVLYVAEMLTLGSVAFGFAFGLYFAASNWLLSLHDDEALLCQSDPHFKNFLRFRIRKDGSIELYPIGVRSVCKKWVYKPKAPQGKPWFEPEEGTVAELASLIERDRVIRIPASAAARR